jgi:hypothetical protein
MVPAGATSYASVKRSSRRIHAHKGAPNGSATAGTQVGANNRGEEGGIPPAEKAERRRRCTRKAAALLEEVNSHDLTVKSHVTLHRTLHFTVLVALQ